MSAQTEAEEANGLAGEAFDRVGLFRGALDAVRAEIDKLGREHREIVIVQSSALAALLKAQAAARAIEDELGGAFAREQETMRGLAAAETERIRLDDLADEAWSIVDVVES